VRWQAESMSKDLCTPYRSETQAEPTQFTSSSPLPANPVTLRVLDAINATDDGDGDGLACQRPLPFSPSSMEGKKGWSAAP
jgi:hypothetical protein